MVFHNFMLCWYQNQLALISLSIQGHNPEIEWEQKSKLLPMYRQRRKTHFPKMSLISAEWFDLFCLLQCYYLKEFAYRCCRHSCARAACCNAFLSLSTRDLEIHFLSVYSYMHMFIFQYTNVTQMIEQGETVSAYEWLAQKDTSCRSCTHILCKSPRKHDCHAPVPEDCLASLAISECRKLLKWLSLNKFGV